MQHHYQVETKGGQGIHCPVMNENFLLRNAFYQAHNDCPYCGAYDPLEFDQAIEI
jgi:hypothetical protein